MSLEIRGKLLRDNGFALDLNLSLPREGLTAVVGPSGSGKSTLLRCIAGLEQASALHITSEEQSWDSLAPHLRPVGYVFQESRLFPHLTVAENLALAGSQSDITDLFIDQLGIKNLLAANPATLSGGQRQRVAVARALLKPARLLLLDEPLAALDQSARTEIATLITNHCKVRKIPALYVSHNMSEVLQIADYLVLMDNGQVRVAGPTHELADLLIDNLQSSRDLGSILEGDIRIFDSHTGLSELTIGDQKLFLPGDYTKETKTIRLYVPAKDITIALGALPKTSVLNQLHAKIRNIHPQDNYAVMLELDIEGQTLLAQITQRSNDYLKLTPGMFVHALVKTMAIRA